eukprot:CAMPEP_0194492346 /NCGR_PEP_ID=MMETSP0253-20130528/10938_1 /TAXON_ID=2966 /ORGANISM="Noctiluca scintillans" /LENGTH=787 /DNA_ID=CAMNT_0039333203 /DNA_START=1 /DNA_END=2364 /DNA_ORIENTATION=+
MGCDKLCVHGCGRAAFREHSTCCTHCKGVQGPHARDCVEKASSFVEKASSFTSRSTRGVIRASTATTSSFACDRSDVVVFRILRAELFRSFDLIGAMDPFCEVEWIRAGEERAEPLGKTCTHKGGHTAPKWNYTLESPYYESNGADRVRFRVLEENFFRAPTFCGEASEKMETLLASAVKTPGNETMLTTKELNLPLIKKGAATGKVWVQLSLCVGQWSHVPKNMELERKSSFSVSFLAPAKTEKAISVELQFTPVCADMFQKVTPINVSGGTASFYTLHLVRPHAGSETYWIGKDIAHAKGEVTFYEDRRVLMDGNPRGMEKLLHFMFEYSGVMDATFGEDTKQLLVLRNLFDGRAHLRLLDIKVGVKTGDAGWHGKSRLHAMRQSLQDKFSNSDVEGYRLEGFDGKPPALESLDPLLDVWLPKDRDQKLGFKAASKLMLQRLAGADIFMHFVDVNAVNNDTSDTSFSPVESSEIVLHEVSLRLHKLATACRACCVPQKWVGSSVAIGFDDGQSNTRSTEGEELLRKSVIVNIFDWGKSELNTLEHHVSLSADEQADRLKFWRFYLQGIDRLAWEASRMYWCRFCNHEGWDYADIRVYDYDSLWVSDFLGTVRIALKPTPETTVPICCMNGQQLVGPSGPTRLTYWVIKEILPKDSRISEIWRVHVAQASSLPMCDRLHGRTTSDPYLAVIAHSANGHFCFRQDGAIHPRTGDPRFDETFELVVRSKPTRLLDSVAGHIESHGINETIFFPASPQAGGDEEVQTMALEAWSRCLEPQDGTGLHWAT